jgi:hypothetical protein
MELDLTTHDSALKASAIRQGVTDYDVNLPVRWSAELQVMIVIVIVIFTQVSGL